MTIPNEAIEAVLAAWYQADEVERLKQACDELDAWNHRAVYMANGRCLRCLICDLIDAARAALAAMHAPPMPPPRENEVERVARAICSASDCDPDRMIEETPDTGCGYSAWGSFIELARAAIAAMNRTPQHTYDDGLRRAAEIATMHARISSNSRDADCYDTAASAILAQLGQSPQPSREELLAALRELEALEHERLTNAPVFSRRSVADIIETLERVRVLIAQADNAEKPEGEAG